MVSGGFLGAQEPAPLKSVIRHPSEAHGVARRANTILQLDDGLSRAKEVELSAHLGERLYRDTSEVTSGIPVTYGVTHTKGHW